MAPAEHTLPVGVAQPATRRFKPEPLPAAVLDTLAAVALSSPSKSDLQQRDILIVEDAAIRARINALLKDQDWIPGRDGCTWPLGLTVHRDRYTDATDALTMCMNWPGDSMLRNPTTGIAGCCARAASGHAAAAPPPLANAKSAFTRSWRRINLDSRCRTIRSIAPSRSWASRI